MKHAVIIALAMLAPLAAFAQDGLSCKAYFQVLWTEPGTPGLHIGMDSGQKRWWEDTGRKKYPGLCFNGSVTSGDKPRVLVIWSKARSFGVFTVNSFGEISPAGSLAGGSGQSSLATNEVYGQKSNALQGVAPKAWIYQPDGTEPRSPF